MTTDPSTARRNTVLGHLDEEALAPLLLDLSETPLPSGQVLHEPGEIIEAVYFPLVGVVSVSTDVGTDRVVETPRSAGSAWSASRCSSTAVSPPRSRWSRCPARR